MNEISRVIARSKECLVLFLRALIILAAAAVCGCGKPANAPQIQKWEYKVVEVKNYARHMSEKSFSESMTNKASIRKSYDDSPGSFALDATADFGEYGVDLYRLGQDGWELISAISQTETLPNVEFENGTTYNSYTQKLDPKIDQFNNTRTGKIILIFKRPSK